MFSLSKTSPGDFLGCFTSTMEEAFWTRFILNRMEEPPTRDITLLAQTPRKTNLYLYRAKAIWDFEGIFCSSRHIPHVRFAGLIHPGMLGCAPSAEVLAEWNRREGELIAANTTSRDVAKPPEPKCAHAGSAEGSLRERIAKEGARTIPVCPSPTEPSF